MVESAVLDTTPIEIAVFDLAGTTVRDPGIVETAVRRATGAAFDESAFVEYRGGSKLDMLTALVGPDEAGSALEEFEHHILNEVESGAIEPLPHADAALERIAAAGARVCVTTGFSTAIRTALLRTLGWTQRVDLALSPDERCRGRPWPDLILEAALQFQASDMAAIAAVGDTANDVTSARRAHTGIAAAVLTGAHDRARLDTAGPSHVFEHVGQFADLVVARSTRS